MFIYINTYIYTHIFNFLHLPNQFALTLHGSLLPPLYFYMCASVIYEKLVSTYNANYPTKRTQTEV